LIADAQYLFPGDLPRPIAQQRHETEVPTMFILPSPRLARGRLVIASGAALVGLSLVQPDPALAQGAYGADRRSCDRGALSQVLSTSKGNLIGSAAGGAIGGLLGNQFGGGSGKALMTVVGVVGGALAGGYVGRSMEPADQACVSRSLEHTPTGQSVAWQNPDNGSSYWVTPTSTYQGGNGQPCRNFITQAVIDGRDQRVEGTACRQSNGAWKTVAGDGVAAEAVTADTVFKAQQKLHDLGFYVRDNIDGRWGPKTSAAVQNFQRAKGLGGTGQLDQPTLVALGLAEEPAQRTAQPAPQQRVGQPAAPSTWQPPAGEPAPVPLPRQ
jgi:surface antigen